MGEGTVAGAPGATGGTSAIGAAGASGVGAAVDKASGVPIEAPAAIIQNLGSAIGMEGIGSWEAAEVLMSPVIALSRH